jgi:hypothetical protein
MAEAMGRHCTHGEPDDLHASPPTGPGGVRAWLAAVTGV